MAGPYEKAQQELAPRWLRRGDGDAWLAASGAQRDDARKTLLDAVRNWFAVSVQTPRGATLAAADDALTHIGSNFGLDKPENLTNDQYRSMLADPWGIWGRAGTILGLTTEIKRLGFEVVAFMPVSWEKHSDDGQGNYKLEWGYSTFEVEQNRLFQFKIPLTRPAPGDPVVSFPVQNREWDQVDYTVCYPPPFNVCLAYRIPYWDYFNLIWSAYYIVIGQPHSFDFWGWGDARKWGDKTWGWDGVKTGDRVLLKRLMLTIRQFGAALGSCRGILFQMPSSKRRRIQKVRVDVDADGQWEQTISTTFVNPIAQVGVWDKFNFGDGTRYGAGFAGVRMREEWEVNDDNPPNIRDQW